MSTKQGSTDLTVAKTILEQLGGRRFIVMTGAKELIGDTNSLTFRINGRYQDRRVNKIRITLDPSDDYTVEVFWQAGVSCKSVAKLDGIYCDMLQECFTSLTGLYTSLGTMTGARP